MRQCNYFRKYSFHFNGRLAYSFLKTLVWFQTQLKMNTWVLSWFQETHTFFFLYTLISSWFNCLTRSQTSLSQLCVSFTYITTQARQPEWSESHSGRSNVLSHSGCNSHPSLILTQARWVQADFPPEKQPKRMGNTAHATLLREPQRMTKSSELVRPKL